MGLNPGPAGPRRSDRRARRRPGYADITATIALVLAMSGGAFAAGHYLITSTTQIKPSVLRHLKGARGPRGVTGPRGSQGPPGVQGNAGSTGPQGVGINDVLETAPMVIRRSRRTRHSRATPTTPTSPSHQASR